MSAAPTLDDSLDGIIVYKENCYDPSDRASFLREFQSLSDRGCLSGDFEAGSWTAFNGVRSCTICFDLDGHGSHMCRELCLSPQEAADRLKLYAISISGAFTFRTIALKVATIRRFLESFRKTGSGFKATTKEKHAIAGFLAFASVPEDRIADIMRRIQTSKDKESGQRTLAPFVNYLAIDSEMTRMYEDGRLEDSEFIHWFPVYFWNKATFILPLRATEMLVTPFGCLEERNGKAFLRVRRTILKGGGHHVMHEVESDYEVCTYEIPKGAFVENLKRYQDLTACHGRRFLFDYGELSRLGIFSLDMMNSLLEEFAAARLIGNHDYDYVRHATGIDEFEPVTAGDSRPIAAANLYYQNVSVDIIRQLLSHVDAATCYHYYSNVANTVMASSIIKAQRLINKGLLDHDRELDRLMLATTREPGTGCRSPRAPMETGNISDCLQHGQLESCFGCPFYLPSDEELAKELKTRRKEMDHSARTVAEYMAGMARAKGIDADKAFLDAQTGLARYREACRLEQEEGARRWQRHRPTRTTSC